MKCEQEVIIRFDAEEGLANLYTADPAWIRKLDKLAEQNPEQFKLEKIERYKGNVISKSYTFPKRFVTIRSKYVKIILTDEQRAERAAKLRELHRIKSTL